MSSQPGTAATSPDPALPSYDPLFEDPSAPEPPATNGTATGAGAAAHEPAPNEAPARVPEPYRPAPIPVTASAPATASAWDTPVAPAAGGRAGRPVDTGRLYHSAGADGPATSEAIPALPLRREAIVATPAVAAIPLLSDPVATASGEAPAPAARPVSAQTGRGLTYLGVAAVITGPTLLVGLVQAVMSHQIGWFTGLVLLVASTYAALTVRRLDFAAAVVVPSLAFLVTTLIAGQLALESGGSLMLRESYMIFRTLAVNAPWILAATAIAAVIVLVRRRRESLHPAT
ncbi:MAG: DUF6542 domain-containing protein [Candidatus Nanopelagicales bacterium]